MKSSLFFFLLLAVSSVSCDTEFLTINRDFSGASITFNVPASDDAGPVAITQPNIQTELRQNLESFGIAEENLRVVAVNTVEAFISDPSGEFTFDDLSNVTLVLSNSTLGTVQIANLGSASGTSAQFEVSDADLKAYLLSDTFDATLAGESAEAIGENVQATVDISYTVTGGI